MISSVYNANLMGYFAIVRFEVSFTAVGGTRTTTHYCNQLFAAATTNMVVIPIAYDGYDRDPTPQSIVRIVLQLLVVVYVLYAFVATEFKEVRLLLCCVLSVVDRAAYYGSKKVS